MTWDWTQVSRTIGEHFTHEANNINNNNEIKIDYLIPAIRLHQIIINKKKNLPSSRLCRPSGPQSENKKMKRDTNTKNLPES